MRPPLNAGENHDSAGAGAVAVWRFNEAPAERGGKLALGRRAAGLAEASMRPPLNAGENFFDVLFTRVRALLQ